MVDRGSLLLRFINFWPPYLGAGIKVKKVAPDNRTIEVEMKLTALNKNYVGTHFGGSLYAMCDPFFMLILIKNLGSDYIVWDKAAVIRFKKPGVGTVRAVFSISSEEIDSIRARADSEYKVEPQFQARVTDTTGEVIAEVDKTLYVRRKDRKPAR